MKKLFLICLVGALSATAFAQRGYFLYLQTDDQSPFYVRMADKIYSSSTAGYLILPNLADSTYNLGIGFAKSTAPETRFSLAISASDKGYLIKSFPEGLSLFDLQELSLVKSTTAANNNTVYETKTDRFSSVLSKAADDPGLLKVPVAKKEEPRSEPEKKEPVVVKKEEPKPEKEITEPAKAEPSLPINTQPKDTSVSKPADTAEPKPEKSEATLKESKSEPPAVNIPPKEEAKKEPAQPETTTEVPTQPYKPSTILRRSESSTTEGFGIVFLDRMEDRTDTVRILIPPSKTKMEDEVPVANLSQIEKRTDNTAAAEEKPAEVKKEPVVQVPVEDKPKAEEKKLVVAASNCKDLASDKDFMKLRKNMAAESNDEAMIEEAKKVFRSKCFNVEQIRYLSTLFLTSAAKYQFLDAAYNHVSDRQNFGLLQSEIKDEYYLKRFKALIGE